MNPPLRFSSSSLPLAAFGAVLVASTLWLTSCGKKDEPSATAASQLKSDDQRVSYGIGYNIGGNLARQRGLTIDDKAFQAGMADALAGQKTRIEEKDIQAAFIAVDARSRAALTKVATENLTAGKAYLAKNKTKKGVTTTASGLQYEVLKAGKGRKPKATDTVEAHYHGTLLDGTVFDSSVEKGQPLEIPLTNVIKGWTEALQLMPVGSKWKLTIPADIGYGEMDRGKIPPNSTLIFEIELLSIK